MKAVPLIFSAFAVLPLHAADTPKSPAKPNVVIIFIDDLDRCPASEVVRVLEAVNLLFGFVFMALAALLRIHSYFSGKFE